MKTRSLFAGILWSSMVAAFGGPESGTFYSTVVLKDKPLAYWNFDEADGNAVQQAPLEPHPVRTENDLLPGAGATRVEHAALQDGLSRLGRAAEFNGSSFFRAASLRAGKAELAGAYAVEFWMQALGENTGDRADYLVNVGGNAPALIYDFKPDQLELYAGSRTDSGPTVSDGAWHHVVFVYYGDGADGVEDRVDAYLDGTPFGRIGNQYSQRMKLSQLVVGAATPAGANGFEGRLDELAIYDLEGLADSAAVTARAEALVARHLAAARGGTDSYAATVQADQPLLYWNFDEAEGNAVQQIPVTFPTPDNANNELAPQFSAVRLSHGAARTGLQLGSAIDLNGEGDYFGRTGGLDLGIPSIQGPWAVEFWFQLKGDQRSRYFLNLGSAGVGYNSPAIIYGYFGTVIEVYGAGNGRSGSQGVPLNDRNWHHLLVVNYNTGPGGSIPGLPQNRVDYYIDNVLYPNVGGDFSKALDLTGLVLFGSAVENPDPNQSGSVHARLDELAFYDLGDLTSVDSIGARAGVMAAAHYAAGFGDVSVGTITVTGHPAAVTTEVGRSVTFSAAATVTGTSQPLTYQWQRNEVNVEGATQPTYTIPSTTINDIGTNQFRVRISAGPVFKFSDSAALVVAMPPPAPATVYSGEVLKDSPVFYWNFDEFLGDAQQLAPVPLVPVTRENDLVPTGEAFRRVSHADLADGLGNLGRAVALDGFSFLQASAPRLPRMIVTNAYAVEAWVRMDGGVNEYLANFGPPGGDNSPALIHNFNQPGYLELYGAGGRVGTGGVQVQDTGWHHLLWVVFNNAPAGSTNRVDVHWDGVAKTNVGGGFSRNLDLRGLLVGAALPGGQNAMSGGIDEFAVYDFTGLDPAEVAARAEAIATNHFTAARATSGPPYSERMLADRPVLYYSFDEDEGNAIQRAPVILAAPDNAANALVNAGARRVQHSAAGTGLSLGHAADFNGVSHFRAPAPQPPKPAIPAPWAVEFWVQVQGDNQDNRQDYLLNFDNSPGFIYDFNPDELEIYAGVRTAGGPVISDGQWHHLMWVFYGDGTVGLADRVDAYLDGTLIPGVRNTYTGRIGFGSGIVVGAAQPGYNGFQGRLDELALYDLAALGSESAVSAAVAAMVTRHLEAARVVIPTLTASRSGGQLTLNWSGSGFVLQESAAPTLSSSWTDLPNGASSPVSVGMEAAESRFFRLVRR